MVMGSSGQMGSSRQDDDAQQTAIVGLVAQNAAAIAEKALWIMDGISSEVIDLDQAKPAQFGGQIAWQIEICPRGAGGAVEKASV